MISGHISFIFIVSFIFGKESWSFFDEREKYPDSSKKYSINQLSDLICKKELIRLWYVGVIVLWEFMDL